MKNARILESDDEGFSLEYDNTRGTRNTMRLEAWSYERPLREARSFLGIKADDHAEDGTRREVE